MSAGVALRAIRTGMRLPLADVAATAGVSPAYLAQVERGERRASRMWTRSVMVALARHLDGAA